MKAWRVYKTLLGLAIGSIMGAGCATNRGILSVQISQPPDSAAGKAVKIVKVQDVRAFELAPKSASVPSLKDGRVSDPSITERAIARKRNGFGKAMGDILLAEGQTVEQLARDAIRKALTEKGYRVVQANDSAYEQAVPVEADVQQFWAWFTPGFAACKLEFEAIVKLRSEVLEGERERAVRGYVLLHTQAATTRAWLNTMEKGIEELVQRIKEAIQTP